MFCLAPSIIKEMHSKTLRYFLPIKEANIKKQSMQKKMQGHKHSHTFMRV